jgi:DNA-binding NarL/FixJ family response regulator
MTDLDKISLLFADDNPVFREIAVRYLRQYDELLVIGVAHGGEDALRQAQALRPQVVVLDLSMPDLTALELLPRLHKLTPGIGTIVMTQHSSQGYRGAALAAGADEFVPKSEFKSALLPSIRRVAGKHRKPPAMAAK